MKPDIEFLLQAAGIFEHYCGYPYFIRCVELAAANPTRMQRATKDLYEVVAVEFETTTGSVVRNIRTIRDVMMKNDGGRVLAWMSGTPDWDRAFPYPRELIAIFSGYLVRNSAGSL